MTVLQISQLVLPVVVRFKAVGNAPIMKQNFYKITSSNRFQAVIQFLRKELGWAANEPLVRVQYISLISMRIFWLTSSPISILHSHPHLTTPLQTSTRYLIDPNRAASLLTPLTSVVICNRWTSHSKLQVTYLPNIPFIGLTFHVALPRPGANIGFVPTPY